MANDEVVGVAEHKLDVGQIAGGIGALSVVALFIAAATAYSYARGVSASLGFPGQIMTLKTSTDIFSGIVFQYTTTFIATLTTGFYFFRRRQIDNATGKRNFAVVLGLFILLLLVGELWDEHGRIFIVSLAIVHFFSPFFVGYSFNVYREGLTKKWMMAAIAALIAFYLSNLSLYFQGYAKGKEVSFHAKALAPGAEHGLATVKVADFPLINLLTKDPLRIAVSAKSSPEGYFYSSTDKCFLRLIAYDDANYYIIEDCNNAIQSMAIRKEVVREIQFLKQL
jgi:hypothetical protein